MALLLHIGKARKGKAEPFLYLHLGSQTCRDIMENVITSIHNNTDPFVIIGKDRTDQVQNGQLPGSFPEA